jgi:hypothetical protein
MWHDHMYEATKVRAGVDQEMCSELIDYNTKHYESTRARSNDVHQSMYDGRRLTMRRARRICVCRMCRWFEMLHKCMRWLCEFVVVVGGGGGARNRRVSLSTRGPATEEKSPEVIPHLFLAWKDCIHQGE